MLHMCVDCMCCVVSWCWWIVCSCRFVVRAILHAFAFVCSRSRLMLRACRLHVWFAFCVVGLFGCACMLVLRVIVYAFVLLQGCVSYHTCV